MSTVIIAGSALAIAMSFILHKLSKSKRNFLDKVAQARIYNPKHVKKDYLPVAVFVGGTGGLGKALAEKYAYYTQGNACIVIAGRNQKAAEDIIASFPKPTHPDARHEFVYIDATLISSAKAAAASLRERLSKVNYLVVSPGFLSSKGRTETSEGIDRKLAAHYYTRWTVINELLPLLHVAKEKGEDAKALSILAPGHGGAMNLDDLGLKKTYSVKNAALQMPSYNDMMVEEFASRNPSLTFIHSAPGLVRTGLFANSDSRFLRLVGPLWWFFTSLSNISPDEFAEATLAGILKSGPGALRMRSDGDDMGKEAYYGSDEARTKVWKHTEETIKVL